MVSIYHQRSTAYLLFTRDSEYRKHKYFCYRAEDCFDLFVEKLIEILNEFACFLRKIKRT